MTAVSVSPHDSRRVLLAGDMLGIGLSEDGGESWQSTFGLTSYEVGDFAWHPTEPLTVWAGTVSGPYVSCDGGRTWEERRGGMPAADGASYTCPVEDVLFDPGDARHLLAFGGSSRGWEATLGDPQWGAVWESRDGGETWSRIAKLTARGPAADLAQKGANIVDAAWATDGSAVYAAVHGVGLFASEDGGRTWEDRSAGLGGRNIERVAVHPTELGTLWACMNRYRAEGQANPQPGGIYKSTDGGRMWIPLSNGLTQRSVPEDYFTSGFKAFSVSRSDPDVMVTCDLSYWTDVLFVSTDGGANWRPVATKKRVSPEEEDPEMRRFSGLCVPDTALFSGLCATCSAIDPSDPNVMFVAGGEYLLRTQDGGTTWTDATAERVGDGWRGRGYTGWCSTNVEFDPRRKGHAILQAMDAGRVWETRDGMRSWRYPCTSPSPWYAGNDVAFAGDTVIYASTGQFGGGGSVLRTRDGETWACLFGEARGLPGNEGQGIATGIHALPDSPDHAWVVFAGRLYETTNGGDRWAPVPRLVGSLGWIAADPRDPRRFFVSGDRTCYVTEDGGTVFTPIGGPKHAGRCVADAQGRFYLGAFRSERAGLWRYAEEHWERVLDEYYAYQVAADRDDPSRLALVTNDHPFHDYCVATGVWLSADGGATWSQANGGLPMLRGQAIAFDPFDPEALFVGTFGRGYFRARWRRDYAPTGSRGYASTAEDAQFAALDPSVLETVKLRNGSMTEGDALPEGWTDEWGDITAARDTEVFRTGPASLRVAANGKSGQAFQMLEAPGGSVLTLSGWLRSAGDVKAQAAVQAFDAGWTRNEFVQLKFASGDTDWTRFERQVTLPDWAARFNVQLLVEGTGQAWLDEVELK